MHKFPTIEYPSIPSLTKPTYFRWTTASPFYQKFHKGYSGMSIGIQASQLVETCGTGEKIAGDHKLYNVLNKV